MSESSSGKQGDRRASQTLCPVVQRFLPLLALQELRPGLERAIYVHLATCESCTDELQRYEAVTRLLRASWKHSGHQESQDSPTTPSIITNHEEQSRVPDLIIEPLPHQDDSILGTTSGNTAQPTQHPNHADAENGALAFARIRNEDFRHALAEALAGRKDANPFPQDDEAPELAISSAHRSRKGKRPQRLDENDAPSDAFTTVVRHSLAAIAQQWHDPTHQSKSEEHDIC